MVCGDVLWNLCRWGLGSDVWEPVSWTCNSVVDRPTGTIYYSIVTIRVAMTCRSCDVPKTRTRLGASILDPSS